MQRLRVSVILILLILMGAAISLSVVGVFFSVKQGEAETTVPVVPIVVVTATPEPTVTPLPTPVVEILYSQEGDDEDFVTEDTYVPSWAKEYVDRNRAVVRVVTVVLGNGTNRVDLPGGFVVARLYVPSPVSVVSLSGVVVKSIEGQIVDISPSCCVLTGEYLLEFDTSVSGERWVSVRPQFQNIRIFLQIVE